MREALLRGAQIVETDLSHANLSGCSVYGTSAWNVTLDGATQTNLIITPPNEPKITVDNLEVAQFLYLILHNEKIREVIDTITSKVVLILGRFTEPRKPVLDALREALRAYGYVPVLFDFAGPASQSTTETITLLARMARFIVADLTDPSSIPHELAMIVPHIPVPVQPLLLEGATTYTMSQDLLMYPWMLPTRRYTTIATLIAALNEQVIAPPRPKLQTCSASAPGPLTAYRERIGARPLTIPFQRQACLPMTHYGNSWGRIALPGGACPLPPSCHQCERYGMLLERQDARTREWRLTEDSNNGVTLRGADYCAGARRSAPRLHLARRHVPRVRVNSVWRLATRWWETSTVVDRLYFRVQTATHQVFRQYCKLAAGKAPLQAT